MSFIVLRTVSSSISLNILSAHSLSFSSGIFDTPVTCLNSSQLLGTILFFFFSLMFHFCFHLEKLYSHWLLPVPATHGVEEVKCLGRMQLTDIIFHFVSYFKVRLASLSQQYFSALPHLPSGSVCRLLQCALLLESF